MNNISDILDFRFSQISFFEKHRNIIPNHILNNCQAQISELNAITDKLGKSLIDQKPTKGIKEVYLKFVSICKADKNFTGRFDKRELKTLSYALSYKENQEASIFNSPDYLGHCFTLLRSNWRDSYLSGLLDCYLSNWGTPNQLSFTMLATLLKEKINSHSGSRRLFQTIRSNLKYFDKDNGDIELGVSLVANKHRISEATKFLSLPDTWITYPYFYGVINSYYEKSKSQLDVNLDDIAKALEIHSSSTKATKSNKLIVSKIICHVSMANEGIQNRVKDMAFKLVGDPGKIAIWRPHDGAFPNDIITINKAREILNEWVTRQFINVFFERCINDLRRKRFWLRYSSNISAFKVFGPMHIKRLLKLDQRIAEYVEERFHAVDSNRDISAFMFQIGNVRMIEFSDPGFAFYAYKTNNTSAPSFAKKYVSSVEEFRNGSMPMLVYRSGHHLYSFADEGRLSHHDGDMNWEDVFTQWIRRKTGVYV